jgi:hypothetical protein
MIAQRTLMRLCALLPDGRRQANSADAECVQGSVDIDAI